jgi:LemA protein
MAKDEKPFYLKPWFIVLAIVAVIVVWLIGSYNNLISLSQSVDNQWAQVETQYQRRIDLIPNLVNTVKGYMQFEKSTLDRITSLRTQWQSAQTTEQKVSVANELESTLSKIILTYENYPQLQSIQAVSSLMDELAGTENRISVERMRYNDRVKDYNTAILMFPTNLMANYFGFTQKSYFQAIAGAEKPPVVNITS